jgi:hypothetical protein
MVPIDRLDDFCKSALEECDKIKSYVIVANEAELKDVMDKVRVYPLLVCVIPAAVGDDVSYDNVAERNAGLFFVLKPMKERMTPAQRKDLWKETQEGMKQLKEYIHACMVCSDFMDLFRDTDFGTREQNPEYQIVDLSGWSILFTFSTDGF